MSGVLEEKELGDQHSSMLCSWPKGVEATKGKRRVGAAVKGRRRDEAVKGRGGGRWSQRGEEDGGGSGVGTVEREEVADGNREEVAGNGEGREGKGWPR